MGTLSVLPPIARYETLPAEPGWFAIWIEGDEDDPTVCNVRKSPIVAWLIHIYPPNDTPVGQYEVRFLAGAHPITHCEFTYDSNDPVVLSPDGTVCKLASGEWWLDVESYVQAIRDRWAADNKQQATLGAMR